jgi:hypothetical protein
MINMSLYDILAREVIDKAIARHYAGEGPSDRMDFDAVLNERWPTRGGGGVSMANRLTIRKVRAAINEFYEPSASGY